MTPDEAIQRFMSSCPPEFLTQTLKVFFGAYQSADEAVTTLPPCLRKEYRAVLRRKVIETNWPAMAKRYEGFSADYVHNRVRSAAHACLEFGTFRLTQSHVKTRLSVPRGAKYRDQYSLTSQRGLFDQADDRPADAPVYLMLIHGQAGNRREPEFIDLVLPNIQRRCYEARISLKSHFAEAWNLYVGPPASPEEEVPDQVNPRLRQVREEQA